MGKHFYQRRRCGRGKLLDTSQQMLSQQFREAFPQRRVTIRRGNVIRAIARRSELVIMNASHQVLRGYRLMILRHTDRPGNVQYLLDEERSDSNYSLQGNVAAFALKVQLTIARCRWEIRVEIGVSQAP